MAKKPLKNTLKLARKNMSIFAYEEMLAEVTSSAMLKLNYDDYCTIDNLVVELKDKFNIDSKGALELLMIISEYV